MNTLTKKIDEIIQETERIWERNPFAGTFREIPYDRELYGIASGVKCTPPITLSPVLDKLFLLAAEDHELEITLPNHFHFTFLALSFPQWKKLADLPVEHKELLSLSEKILHRINWKLCHLRLVALNNTLLLVGTPDETSDLLRNAYAHSILASGWEKHLVARYRGLSIPPLLWHSTLARYKREFFSPALRNLFREFKQYDYGEIYLGTPTLYFLNYNWTKMTELGE